MRHSNMPSLARVLDILTPVPIDRVPPHLLSGMDATVTSSVRITSAPQGGGRPMCPCGKTLGHPDPCDPSGPPRI